MKEVIASIIFSILFIPLSYIVPKRKSRIVFIGRDNGLLLDNVKHFFVHVYETKDDKCDALFITSDAYTQDLLDKANLPVTGYPSLTAIIYLLSANIIIVDSVEWISGGKFHLGWSSKIVQLWHGAPLKEIELPLYKKRLLKMHYVFQIVLRAQKLLTGRYARSNLVLSTSSFIIDNAFKDAFNTESFLNSGYPRNDALFKQIDYNSLDPILLNTDKKCIQNILKFKTQGKKIFCYMPTFRKEKECPITSGILNFNLLNDFLVKVNGILIVKVHPYLADVFEPANYQNILSYKTTCDIYPALSITDCLITDYSSIYFDYLLLDKPIIFFTYDFESYTNDDRNLLFDFDEFSPGPTCVTQKELENEMKSFENDNYATKRCQVKEKIFDYRDGQSSIRLWGHIRKHYIEN